MTANGTIGAAGKLFLAGEYGVLYGGAAVVTAVDRRVAARFVPGAAPSSPVVAEAVEVVRAHAQIHGATLPAGAPELDSAALSSDGRKLGLGSSAAVAAAAVAVALEAAGLPVAGDERTVFRLAEQAHRASQGGRGSGADVAAAVFGGVLAYARPEHDAPLIRPLAPRPALEPVVVTTGSPSATVNHVRAVEHLAARDPALHARRLDAIRQATGAFLEAYERGDARRLLDAVSAAHQALEALGRDADLPIVTPALAQAAALAAACGGAAKPSGAGGGDVGLAFFADLDGAAAFRAGVGQLDLAVLGIKTGARGLARGG